MSEGPFLQLNPMSVLSVWETENEHEYEHCRIFDEIDAAMEREMYQQEALECDRINHTRRMSDHEMPLKRGSLGCAFGELSRLQGDCEDLVWGNEPGEKVHLCPNSDCNFFTGEPEEMSVAFLFQETNVEVSGCYVELPEMKLHSQTVPELECSGATSSEMGVVPDLGQQEPQSASSYLSESYATVPEMLRPPQPATQTPNMAQSGNSQVQIPNGYDLKSSSNLPLLASLSATLLNLNQRTAAVDIKSRVRKEGLERYRAKKARRMFSKKIRYQLRKINADKRPRVKGRFVKKDQVVETDYSGTNSMEPPVIDSDSENDGLTLNIF